MFSSSSFGQQPLGSADNPYPSAGGGANYFQPPDHFRRHGTAEQSQGGIDQMGITPPGTPPRSRNSSPRGSPRGNRRSRVHSEDDEPPARRDRSRDRDDREAREPNVSTTSMPTEWGGRTLRLERMVQDCVTEINILKSLVTELQGKVAGDGN